MPSQLLRLAVGVEVHGADVLDPQTFHGIHGDCADKGLLQGVCGDRCEGERGGGGTACSWSRAVISCLRC